MLSWLSRHFVSIVVYGFGLIFLTVGIWVGVFEARRAGADADRVAALPPVSAAAIDDRPAGRETLVEGTVSPRNRARFRDFVAYVREEYRGRDDDNREIWREDERQTPELLIEAGGVVQLANADYAFSGALHRWEEGGGVGRKRYAGLAAGQVVTALGVVEPGPEGNLLRAEFVFAGSRAAYIADRRGEAAWLPWFGLIFVAVGALVLLVGYFTLRR